MFKKFLERRRNARDAVYHRAVERMNNTLRGAAAVDSAHGWDVVWPVDNEYPDEPFFNKVVEKYGHPAYYRFMMGVGYGCETLQEWRDMINADPERWIVVGERYDFRFMPVATREEVMEAMK